MRETVNIDRLLAILGVILGVIGLILAYVFYKRGLRLKKPLYLITSNNLIQDSVYRMNGLNVLYKNVHVENLTVSKIIFWNSGSETIDNNDIVSANPLRIECSQGVRLLDVEVIKQNNLSNQFKVMEISNDGSANLIFEYLDKGHGAVLQAVHTGKSSNDIRIKGDLKGCRIHMRTSRKKLYREIAAQIGPMGVSACAMLVFSKFSKLTLGWVIVIALFSAIISFFVLFKLSEWMVENFSDEVPKNLKTL